MIKSCLYLISASVLAVSAIAANPIGELHANIGAIEPQGNYSRYADLGPTANLRLTFHIPQFKAFSLWTNLNGSFFSSEKSFVDVYGDPYVSGADQTVSEYAMAFHLGAQLGSDSQKGFFRPYAGIGPGIYFFNTETTLDVPYMEEHYYQDTQTQVKSAGAVCSVPTSTSLRHGGCQLSSAMIRC